MGRHTAFVAASVWPRFGCQKCSSARTPPTATRSTTLASPSSCSRQRRSTAPLRVPHCPHAAAPLAAPGLAYHRHRHLKVSQCLAACCGSCISARLEVKVSVGTCGRGRVHTAGRSSTSTQAPHPVRSGDLDGGRLNGTRIRLRDTSIRRDRAWSCISTMASAEFVSACLVALQQLL